MSLNVEVVFDVQNKELNRDLRKISREFKDLGKSLDTGSRSLRRMDGDMDEVRKSTRKAADEFDRFGDEARENLGRVKAAFGDLRGIGSELGSALGDFGSGIRSLVQGDVLGALGDFRQSFSGLATATSQAGSAISEAMNPLTFAAINRLIAAMADKFKEMRAGGRGLLGSLFGSLAIWRKPAQDLSDAAGDLAAAADDLTAATEAMGDIGKASSLDDFIQGMVAANLASGNLTQSQRDSIAIMGTLSQTNKDNARNQDKANKKADSGATSLKGLAKYAGLAVAGIAVIGTTATVAAAAVVAAAGLMAGALIGVTAAISVRTWATFTDQVDQFARTFGASIPDAQAWTRVFARFGLDLNDTVEIMSEFASKADDVADAFPNIKWDSTDMLSNFEAVITELQNMENETLRNQLAFELFGEEGAKQLIPLISGTQELSGWLDQLAQNPWVSEEDIERVRNMRDSWNELKSNVQGVMVQIGSLFAPVVERVLNHVTTFMTEKVLPAVQNFFNEFVAGFKHGANEGEGWGRRLGAAAANVWAWMKKAYNDAVVPMFNKLKEFWNNPDVQRLARTLLPLLAKLFGGVLYGALIAANHALGVVLGTISAISWAIGRAIDLIKWFIDQLSRIPSWARGGASFLGNLFGASGTPAAPMGARVANSPDIMRTASMPMTAGTPTGATGNTYNINVSGALDPHSTARQINNLLRKYDSRTRGQATWR